MQCEGRSKRARNYLLLLMDNRANVNKHVDKVPMLLPRHDELICQSQWQSGCFFCCISFFNLFCKVAQNKTRKRTYAAAAATSLVLEKAIEHRNTIERVPLSPLPRLLPSPPATDTRHSKPDWHAQRHSMSFTINFHNCPASVSRWIQVGSVGE